MAKQASKTPAKAEAKGTQLAAEPAGGSLWGLRREMDRLFDDFRAGLPAGWPMRRAFDIDWPREHFATLWGETPSVDVSETDKAYEIEAELPGMDEKDIELSLSNGVLTIRGERKEEKEDKEKHVSERRYGSFRRTFRLPDTVNEDKATAEFKKGVLRVTLPKKPEAQKPVRKIAIRGG